MKVRMSVWFKESLRNAKAVQVTFVGALHCSKDGVDKREPRKT